MRSKAFYCLLLLLVIGNSCFAALTDPIRGLVHRVAPAYGNRILFETISTDSGKDVFELESAQGKLTIRGNNFNSMAVGLNYYLNNYCHTSVSWYKNDAVYLPSIMPMVAKKVKRSASVKNRFFLNYCTFGYTMPWWQWADWERLIDWMALHGINMPLSITGEEMVWYKVWKKFGLTDEQIRSYFTGPAYLPWHRMANIDKWEGALPLSWLNGQFALQKKIVARERELNMTPVLPAFAGHVPAAIKTRFPNAKITSLGSWGGFSKKYQSNFLDPFDPLFNKIQQSFLTEQTKAFGTDHIYGADPFNEVTPPSWEPDYLASVSKTIYNSMAAIDPKAVWLQMSWLFYIDRDKWTNERIRSFLTAVPQNKMMLLDYYCENTEVWKLTDSFYKQPYLWCYLGNFGGNTMLAGNLREVEARMQNALNNGGANLSGIGSTLEGFDMNPMMYDYVFEKAWSNGPVDVDKWINGWAKRRAGDNDRHVENAWQQLLNTAYGSKDELGQATLTNAKPGFTGHGNWTTNPQINYKNADLLIPWQQLIKSNVKANANYNFDVVNVGRQVMGNYFSVLRDRFTAGYNKKDIPAMKKTRAEMLGLFDDMDKLLATHSAFLLGKWINDARNMGATPQEKDYYEKDARSIVTIWGGDERSLNDYANRSWAGLTQSFYKQRWQMFLDAVILSAQQHKPFDEKAFKLKLNALEDGWVLQHNKFAAVPVGNSVKISRELYQKYAPAIADTVGSAVKKDSLTTYNIQRCNYKGLPIFDLDGGMSAEYAVEKAGESLASGMSHSWKVNGRGSGPNQVYATPAFLENSIKTTVDFYDNNLGAHTTFNTVIISTGIPSVPYLARAMKAPVLPLHFLVSANTVKEVRQILDYSARKGYSAYSTFGYDASVPNQGVAWVKLLDIPAAYTNFLKRHHVQYVIMLGATSNVGGEATAKKVITSTSKQAKYAPGSLFILYPQGGVKGDSTELMAKVKDFNTVNQQKNFTRVADWESGIIPEQLKNFSKTIKRLTTVKNTWFITGSDDDDLYNLATYVMAAFMHKNLYSFTFEAKFPIKGIILNPYLISNPGFESRFGYLPFVYWQGNSSASIIKNMETTVSSALSVYFSKMHLSKLNIWINSSLNFGAAERSGTLSAALKTNGFDNIKANNFSEDEVWNPANGINAPCELKTATLLKTVTPRGYKKWNDGLYALTISDINYLSKKVPAIVVKQLN